MLPHQLRVIVLRDADVDTYLAAGEVWRGVPRILDGVPCALQSDALLGVEVACLPRRHPEEKRVEAVDVRDEPAPLAVRLVRLRFGITDDRPPVPPLRRYLRNATPGCQQIVPELAIVRRT